MTRKQYFDRLRARLLRQHGERDAKIRALAAADTPLAVIGRRYHLSRERVRQIVAGTR